MRQTIESHPGWEVCGEASDGLEAVSKAAELTPDLVILDLTMPNLNGMQAAKAIRMAAPKLPLLMFTEHLLEPFLAEEARNAGFNGGITKVSYSLLVTATEALLRGDSFFAAVEPSSVPGPSLEANPEVTEPANLEAPNDEPN
jgi:DNA-binding NarL/FixJ family response regulator